MLPGPLQLPKLPPLPFNIPPLLLWVIILGVAVLLAVTFFKFIFAEPGERINSFFIFFLALLGVVGLYFLLIYAPEITGFFRRLTSPLFKWR